MMHRHQAKDATTHPRESPLATEQQCCSQVTVDACDKNNALEGEKMKSAVIACLLLILALALAGCQSQTAHCYSSPPPRAMRSTVFNTTQHRALAQSNGTADVPASSQWYYARRDVPPAGDARVDHGVVLSGHWLSLLMGYVLLCLGIVFR